MTDKDLKLLKSILQVREYKLHKILDIFLRKYYDKITSSDFYTFAEGDIPIALVAHMDTVFPRPPREIYHDKDRNTIWSPQGLGADDRAGVYAIIQIILKGYKPHVIFTTEEERGGIGAFNLVQDYPLAPFKDLRYMIQLDRCGFDNCVFYNCVNNTFNKYIESFGFVTEEGLFSDISILAPNWGIAATNLSIGYIREHTAEETLFVNTLIETTNKVCKMLDEKDIPYAEYVYKADGICRNCRKIDHVENLFPVQCNKHSDSYFCIDCIADNNIVKWCEQCGTPFFDPKSPNEVLCYDCRDSAY